MRLPAATVLVAMSLALGGCGAADTAAAPFPVAVRSDAGAGGGAARPSITPTGTPTLAATAPATETVAAVAAALHVDGECSLDGDVLNPPSDPEVLCRWGQMILGHAYPDGRGLLGRVAGAARVGDRITIDGVAFTVRSIQSIPKEQYDPASGPALVTCDITQGYDATGHSLKNLVVSLSPTT